MAHRGTTLSEGRSVRRLLGLLAWAGVLLVLLAPAAPRARGPAARLQGPVDDLRRATLAGTRPPQARAEADAGALPGETRLEGATLVLQRTPAQEEELGALLAAQHDPASRLYHRWLTPEAFAERFGVAEADLAALAAWLEGHGLRVERVARARDRLRFSGTAAQLQAAFGTELRTYQVDGELRFAPAADVTLPAALAPLVQGVTGLSSFRPRPHLRPSPRFTSAMTGAHFVAPGDVATIYGVNPVHAAGWDGAGVAIAVVGQSAVALADVRNFRSAAGLPARDPELVLVPSSGSSVHITGDEAESDLDLEWAGAMAPGATLRLVYVGNAANQSVWDAIAYAVDQDLAPIISVSYGACEPALGASGHASLEAVLAQAAAQGQSVVVASGDAGSLDCHGQSGIGASAQQALAVDFPASSAYVTAVGGTEFPDAAVAKTATQYWAAAPSAAVDAVSSALSYIPEQVWNDGLGSAGGGGVSVFTPRPAWQAGVAGLPAGGYRAVPDLSLDASPVNAPLLFCSSDTGSPGVPAGSCSSGFRDGTSQGLLTTAGGTSFGAPILAGMLALAEQKLGQGGLGVVAPTLYRLAADATTYAAAFHDITQGGNQCPGSAGPACSSAGASAWAAGAGYDAASGLGSIDLAALLDAWPAGSPGFTVEAADTGVSAGGSGSAALTVVPVDGYAGTIAWTVTSTPALGAGCLAAAGTDVVAGTVAHASVTIRAASSACTTAPLAAAGTGAGRGRPGAPGGAGGLLAGLALSALGVVLGGGALGKVTRRRRLAALLAAALALPVALAACGGGSSGGVARATTGTYAVQVVGTDAHSASITATATFTLTVR
jgi:hypothetical protein